MRCDFQIKPNVRHNDLIDWFQLCSNFSNNVCHKVDGWMSVFGLTGGIGMGKSTVASMFSPTGFSRIDTDEIAHKLTMIGGAALPEICACFGTECLNEDGSLNRVKMAKRVFSDANERRKLESILHPKIRNAWQIRAKPFRKNLCTQSALVIIPLLFETDFADDFDQIICVACSEKTQMERLKMRGWSEAEAQARIDAQLPIAEKMARSDWVIWTDCAIAFTEKQVEQGIKKFRSL